MNILKKMLHTLLYAGLLLVAFTLGFALMVFLDFQDFLQTPTQESQIFAVKAGESRRAIAKALQDAKLIDNAWYFLIFTAMQSRPSLKAGLYEIPAGSKVADIFAILQSGVSVSARITWQEGWRFEQVRAVVEKTPGIVVTPIGQDPAALAHYLAIPQGHVEGWLFPDTYFFTPGSEDLTVFKRAYEKMQTILAELWAERRDNLPLQTPYQALILASIIEKETAVPEERPLVASVFINRLNMGMRLQTDPTVLYGLGADFQGILTRRHLKNDHPHNTYTRSGLPPTPIAMPGAAALAAALQPAETDYLYFVATGKDGRHQFSRTLAEHQRAVQAYRVERNRALLP
jgi:UPF0755 protein